MSNTSVPLFVPPDRPLDPVIVELLAALSRELARLACPFMLVGATARDILLVHVFGMHVARATMDVDIAVEMDDWSRFAEVRNTLTNLELFASHPGISHRLYYHPRSGAYRYPVDIVPFGRIENPQGFLSWPPDHDFVMNVVGFRDAFSSRLKITATPALTFDVVSLGGLAILKLVAWEERHIFGSKDASDLNRLLQSYADAGNIDRLYDNPAILEAEGFDVEAAGSHLLGEDVAGIASVATRQKLIQLLTDSIRVERLADQMLDPYQLDDDAVRSRVWRNLNAFIRGLRQSHP